MAFLKINNEYARLRRVILGCPTSFGGTPNLGDAYDPKSKLHIKKGTFPVQEDITSEMTGFRDALIANGVEVLRPNPIADYNQIFSRDIGCVIQDKFLIANIIQEREREIEAISEYLKEIPADKIVRAPEGVRFEGGDIMPHNEYIFIGHSKAEDFAKYKVSRTNEAGVDFIKSTFPEKKIKAFELHKSDDDPKENALHLDCCFQPFGLGHAIIHENGFKNPEEYQWLLHYIGEKNCLKINKDQMFDMGANLFSIAKDHVISDERFTEVNAFLESKGYRVTKIKYGEIAKMEGLLRCSTLPLYRED